MMQPKSSKLYEHPLFNSMELKIRTTQIKNLYDTLTHWLWLGFSGGIIMGDARVGKTTALMMLLGTFLNRQKQTIPCKFATMPKRDQPTIRAVFYCLANALKIKFNTRATSDVLSELVKNKLADLSCLNDTKTVLLVVDEVQRLTLDQFNAFAELHDDLRPAKINLCIVFIANTAAFSVQIEKLKTNRFEHIRGRFFNQCYMFYGFRTSEELKFTLKQFDTLVSPGTNNLSYTEFFLPDEFKKGFKLASLADLIWSVFHKEFQLKHEYKSWPAKYFFEFVSVLLGDYLYKYGVNTLSENMISNAINATGLLPSSIFNDSFAT